MHARSMNYCLFSMHTAGNVSLGVYRYTSDLLALRATVSSEVVMPPECSVITSPLKPDVWESYRSAYPDIKHFVEYLVDGVRCGFCIGCCASSVALQSATRNMPAADLHPTVIENYLSDELSCNRLAEAPSALVHVSKFGVIPKKHQPGSGG